MTTSVNALSDVDYALDVHVPAADLEPRVIEALKKQRAGMNLKGFRPGKVPLQVVRKMVGPQLALQIAEEVIGEAYREAVAESEAYDVIGQPRLAELDYDPQGGGDLHAVVKFGVRPSFDLADLDGMPVTRFVRTFSDEDVDADLQRRRDQAAELVPAPEGAALAETDVATVDIQPVDPDGAPTGPKQHGAQVILADPGLREELRAALLGKAVGDAFRLELPHEHGEGEGHDHDDHVDRYQVEVTAVQNRVLPEMDAAFVEAQTEGRTNDLDALRGEIREQLERSWERRATEALESRMVEQFVEAHPFPVPETLIEAALDGLVEELRQRNQGQLAPDFDVAAWREARREQAAMQVRWYLLKDRLVTDAGIELTNEDFEAEFAEMAGEGMDPDMVREYFTQQPRLLEQLGDQLLNRRVFDVLSSRFTVVDKTREDLERERAEREAALADAPVELAPAFTDDPAGEAAADAAAAEPAPAKKKGLFGRRKKDDE